MQQAEEDAVEASSSSFCTSWDSIVELIILGVGSLEKAANSRYQLALALLIAEILEQRDIPIKVQDPVFSDLDKKVVEDLNIQVHPRKLDALLNLRVLGGSVADAFIGLSNSLFPWKLSF